MDVGCVVGNENRPLKAKLFQTLPRKSDGMESDGGKATCVNNGEEEQTNKEAGSEYAFSCILKILERCIFRESDPIAFGVEVLEGTAKVGDLICVPKRGFMIIGTISAIEYDHCRVKTTCKGQYAAIKIVGRNPVEKQLMLGRDFDVSDELVCRI